jgi:FtsH-binding integral membrane protein
MGLMLSRLVGMVLGLANGAGLIMTAFAGTGAMFLGMASLSSVIKRDLSRWASGCSSAPSCCWWPASPTSSCSPAR